MADVQIEGYIPPMKPDCAFAERLEDFLHQQVTVYVSGLGPVANVPVFAPTTAGATYMPASASGLAISGMLHAVGRDFVELHVMSENVMRMVFIPVTSIAAIVPGGPLVPPNTVQTPAVEL